MRLFSFFLLVLFVVVEQDSLAQTIRYLPIPPPVVSALPPCRAPRTIADNESTGFMLVFKTPVPANLRNSTTQDVQVFFDISKDSLFSSDVLQQNSSNIARRMGITLYSRLCFGNAINFNGQIDTMLTSSRYISNQMIAVSQLMPIFQLFDDSTYYVRAFTYIITDSTIIVSPPSKILSIKPNTQRNQISISGIQPYSINASVLFSEQHIPMTTRLLVDSVLIEASADSLFQLQQSQKVMLPVIRVLRQFSTIFYTFDATTFTNLRPATQYFFRFRPFSQGKPIRPYFEVFSQYTAAISTQKISISSIAIDLLAFNLDNSKVSNRCTTTFVYTRTPVIAPQQADSIMLTLTNQNIEFGNNVYFQDSTGKSEFLVQVSPFAINAEEQMKTFGFVRKNIDWSGLCKCVNIRTYFAKPLATTATTISDDSYTLSLSTAPNPLSDEGDIRFSLPHSGFASLSLLDMTGSRIASFAEGTLNAGVHSLPLNTSHLASGQYILVLQTPTERVYRLITVLH